MRISLGVALSDGTNFISRAIKFAAALTSSLVNSGCLPLSK